MSGRQQGAVLALALMFLALTATTAALAPRVAALELARSAAVDALSRSELAAATGLGLALETVDLLSTAPATLIDRDMGEASVNVDARFLGFRTPADGDLLEWHFLLTATGRSARGARAIHRQQVFVLAPAAPDPAACLDPGCPVPPICDVAVGCATELRAPPVVAAWHLPGTTD